MSSAIKPPGAGTPNIPVETPALGQSEGTGEAFRASANHAGDASAVDRSASSQSIGRTIADGLRSGTLTPEAAVEQLVQRALSSEPAASLPPARRAELESTLRSALSEDPTLLEMQRDLGRAR